MKVVLAVSGNVYQRYALDSFLIDAKLIRRCEFTFIILFCLEFIFRSGVLKPFKVVYPLSVRFLYFCSIVSVDLKTSLIEINFSHLCGPSTDPG